MCKIFVFNFDTKYMVYNQSTIFYVISTSYTSSVFMHIRNVSTELSEVIVDSITYFACEQSVCL